MAVRLSAVISASQKLVFERHQRCLTTDLNTPAANKLVAEKTANAQACYRVATVLTLTHASVPITVTASESQSGVHWEFAGSRPSGPSWTIPQPELVVRC